MITEIGGRSCELTVLGEPRTVFLWAADRDGREESGALLSKPELAAAGDFALLRFGVEDWFGELSPWAAEAGEYAFTGGGADTLRWLAEECVPYLKSKWPEAQLFPAGYSLAGLFSLWAALERPCFSGAVCCSGTMWFPGWEDYLRTHRFSGAPGSRLVYLSLGGKEERAKDPLAASIGDRTRAAEKLLRGDPAVRACTLVMNSGGHFADPCGRLAKGLAWILARSA